MHRRNQAAIFFSSIFVGLCFVKSACALSVIPTINVTPGAQLVPGVPTPLDSFLTFTPPTDPSVVGVMVQTGKPIAGSTYSVSGGAELFPGQNVASGMAFGPNPNPFIQVPSWHSIMVTANTPGSPITIDIVWLDFRLLGVTCPNCPGGVGYDQFAFGNFQKQIPVASGTPTFSVELGSYGSAMAALATAKIGSQSMPLQTAAQMLGFDHFNWVQVVKTDPDLAIWGGTNCSSGGAACVGLTNISGQVPKQGTIDPPLGGWKYQGSTFPTQDFNPFYWDEYFNNNGEASPLNPEYKNKQTTLSALPSTFGDFAGTSTGLSSAYGFLFADQPGQFNPGTSQFVDFLVGVSGNCNTIGPTTVPCTYTAIPNTNFTWTSTNGVVGFKNPTVDETALLASILGLGCSDAICGDLISLDEALSLTGLTLESFEALGNSTPLPAALPLFVTGLGALGLLGWRRKRKAAANRRLIKTGNDGSLNSV